MPKHNGRFNYKTGEAKGAPVCVNLKTYPVKVEAGKVFIQSADDGHGGHGDRRRRRMRRARRLCAARARLRGPVTLIGEEQHRPYERPPLSKDALTLADRPGRDGSPRRTASEEKRIDCIAGKGAVASTGRPRPSGSPTAPRCPMTSCCWRPARSPADCRSPNRPAAASPISGPSPTRCRSATTCCPAATSRSSAAASSGWSSPRAPANAAPRSPSSRRSRVS